MDRERAGRPRRPLWTNAVERIKEQIGEARRGEEPEKPDRETELDEGVAAGAALERERLRLEGEIERLRQIEAGFEEKYHASLDEFQARYRPGENPEADEDYLQWAHVAEQLRQAQARLAHVTHRALRKPTTETEPLG